MKREFKTVHINGECRIFSPEPYFEMLANSRGRGDGWWALPIVSKVEREHIVYDPDVKEDYFIIRQQSHDGLLAYTYELIFRALLDLVHRRTWYKPVYDETRHKTAKYIIGDIHLATVYKLDGVDLPCGKYPGEIERLRIPVKYVLS